MKTFEGSLALRDIEKDIAKMDGALEILQKENQSIRWQNRDVRLSNAILRENFVPNVDVKNNAVVFLSSDNPAKHIAIEGLEKQGIVTFSDITDVKSGDDRGVVLFTVTTATLFEWCRYFAKHIDFIE